MKPSKIYVPIILVTSLLSSIAIVMFAILFDGSNNSGFTGFVFDFSLVITYIFLFTSIFFAILFPIIYMFKNFKNAKKILIGIVAFAILFLIVYALSPAEQGPFYDKMNVSPILSKFIGSGLYLTYIFFAGTIIAFIYTFIAQRLK